ncbi:NUDIX domain-containing protein [Streptomyces sp. NPDC088846]|uniref:NUDIX domain-containing protein n=1 Tax=Streptomyces sp. NPDC088846 TaxID=3365908 RepID=UPI0037F32C6A
MERIAARFPLVPRPGLTCPDLMTRITEVGAHALAADRAANPTDQLHRAGAAFNLAALIAADCGMLAYATDLCVQQFQLLHAAWPASGRAAIAALQPLVNLARLTHRAGDATGAYRALLALATAVADSGSYTMRDAPVSFEKFAATDHDRGLASEWLRAIIRQDGPRLLATAGQWDKAAEQAALGATDNERLLEGRQLRILADLMAGRSDSALILLTATVTAQPWERAVAACLRGLGLFANRRFTAKDAASLLATVESHCPPEPHEDTNRFRPRLCLTVADLISAACRAQANRVHTMLIQDVQRSNDAFAARDLLQHPGSRGRMTLTELGTLTRLVQEAGLGRGSIPQPALGTLQSAIATAESALVRARHGRAGDDAVEHPTPPFPPEHERPRMTSTKATAHPVPRTTEPPGTAALLVDNAGRYLLHLRDANKPIWAPGQWACLGGNTEPGESCDQAIVRELIEETGLDVPGLVPFVTLETVDPAGVLVNRVLVYLGTLNRPSHQIPLHEGIQLRWTHSAEIAHMTMAPGTAAVIREHLTHPCPRAEADGKPPTVRVQEAGEHRDRSVVGAHLYLECGGAVLLGKRHPDSAFAPSTWHLPAGHREAYESAIACVIRETAEETGIIIEPSDLSLVHTLDLRDTDSPIPRIQLFFAASRWSGEPQVLEPERCTQWRWWPLNVLPDQLVGYTRTALAAIARGTTYTSTGWPS